MSVCLDLSVGENYKTQGSSHSAEQFSLLWLIVLGFKTAALSFLLSFQSQTISNKWMWLLDRKDVLPDYSLEKSNAFTILIPIPLLQWTAKKTYTFLKRWKLLWPPTWNIWLTFIYHSKNIRFWWKDSVTLNTESSTWTTFQIKLIKNICF